MKKTLLITVLLINSLITSAQFIPKQEIGPIPDLGWSNIQHLTVDLDQDGDFDVICAGAEGLGWIENLGINIYAEYVELRDGGINDFDISDYNNDGHLDIVYASLGLLYFSENNGVEEFLSPINIGWYYMSGGGEKVECVDMNGDGIEDVVTRGTFNRIVWRENPGTGVATEDEFAIEIDEPLAYDWEIIDIDDDGDMDICWADYGSDEGLWFGKNLGDGTFVRDTLYKGIDFHPLTIDFADMNNDGLLDVVFSGVFRVGWVENFGAGEYSELNVLTTDPYDPKTVHAEDVDMDGLVDIVYIDPDASQVLWLKNLGAESFSEPIIITEELIEPGDLNLIDFDGDGDLDIISGETGGVSLGYFRNITINLTTVQGNIYIDLNENGIREEDEIGLPYSAMTSSPLEAYAVTSYDGSYFMDFYGLPEGTYEIFPDIENWGVSSAYATHTVVVDSPFVYMDTLDFGMYPETPVDSIAISLIGPATYRCNISNLFYLNILNIGATIPSGVIHFTLDDSLTYLSADIAPDSIVGQNIYWTYTDLFYFESRDIQVNVLMPDGIDDAVTTHLSANVLAADVSVFDAEPDSETETVVCAYDPNDKKVSPKGVGEFGNIPPETDLLEYTIRFQNTGTDTAFVVIIRDQLDDNLDWFTFEPLSSSHTMLVDYDPSGEIAFVFDNIMLPDSGANYNGSQGYVNYQIRPKTDLPLGTTIENTAAIYFDFNPAIITNTTLNTIAEINDVSVPELDNNISVSVYPNPADDFTYVKIHTDNDSGYSIRLFNIVGQQVYAKHNQVAGLTKINTSQLDDGMYLLVVTSENGDEQIYSSKLIIK